MFVSKGGQSLSIYISYSSNIKQKIVYKIILLLQSSNDDKIRIINNDAIESHHSHQKEFHKVRRGVTEVQDYQDGFKVFHNFVRKNARQGLTPADKVGVGVQGNAWETMLLNAIKLQNSRHLTGGEKMMITP